MRLLLILITFSIAAINENVRFQHNGYKLIKNNHHNNFSSSIFQNKDNERVEISFYKVKNKKIFVSDEIKRIYLLFQDRDDPYLQAITNKRKCLKKYLPIISSNSLDMPIISVSNIFSDKRYNVGICEQSNVKFNVVLYYKQCARNVIIIKYFFLKNISL